jgi:hypothetical protein
LGVVKRSGTWISFGGHRWQGETRFAECAKPEVLDEIEQAARAKFEEDAGKRADVVGP